MGLLNTLLVAGLGIVAATLLGFVVGIARLSSNWLVARLATAYVEIVRNLPLLLQLFFWYFAVLKNLPAPRQSYALPGGAYLNVRGLYLPAPGARARLRAGPRRADGGHRGRPAACGGGRGGAKP